MISVGVMSMVVSRPSSSETMSSPTLTLAGTVKVEFLVMVPVS